MEQTSKVFGAPQSAQFFGAPQSAQLMIDLEAQQDNLLRELDELNQRIEQAIVVGQMGVRRATDSIADVSATAGHSSGLRQFVAAVEVAGFVDGAKQADA